MTITRIIERGAAYDTYLTARNTVLDAAHHTLFPVGIYHLVVQYALRVDGGSYGINRLDGGEDGFTLYSQPFGVCVGGVCS